MDRLLFRTRGKTEKERKHVIRRVSGRNQLVGTNRRGPHQRSDGGNYDFDWRPANHIDYYFPFRAGDAAKAGADCSRSHQGHGGDDSTCVTSKNRLFFAAVLFALLLQSWAGVLSAAYYSNRGRKTDCFNTGRH